MIGGAGCECDGYVEIALSKKGCGGLRERVFDGGSGTSRVPVVVNKEFRSYLKIEMRVAHDMSGSMRMRVAPTTKHTANARLHEKQSQRHAHREGGVSKKSEYGLGCNL